MAEGRRSNNNCSRANFLVSTVHNRTCAHRGKKIIVLYDFFTIFWSAGRIRSLLSSWIEHQSCGTMRQTTAETYIWIRDCGLTGRHWDGGGTSVQTANDGCAYGWAYECVLWQQAGSRRYNSRPESPLKKRHNAIAYHKASLRTFFVSFVQYIYSIIFFERLLHQMRKVSNWNYGWNWTRL